MISVRALVAKPSPGDATTQPSKKTAYDIAIICALHEKELDNVLGTGQKPWQPRHIEGDPTTYYETTYPRENRRPLRVVAGAAPQMGMPASAVLTTKMILHWIANQMIYHQLG